MTEFFFCEGEHEHGHAIALTNNLVGIDELKIHRNRNLACRQICTSNLMNEKYVRSIGSGNSIPRVCVRIMFTKLFEKNACEIRSFFDIIRF